MTTVALEGLTRRYGETTALAGIDLTVADGEFFTLVGPSGCGKTTTLRLIAGFEAPSAGSVAIDGEPMAGVAPERRGVGVVFQNYALFPNMSVGENVAYGLRFADPPAGVSREERVADLLELVDLGGMQGRDPDALSGGQQQRVALARALAPGPRLLLLDEPMSALDAQLRERLRVQVREIQRELGITTVYVTHDQEEALSVSDRVAVMRDGRVEQVGTPREVYDRPATRFAAEFVGDNNLFTGRVPQGEPRGETEGVAVAVGDREFRLDPDARAGASISSLTSGREVTFCVRPEDLATDAGTNRFPVDVESAEFLGATTRVHGTWAGREITMRTDADLEGTVTVGFDPADAHVVDLGDGGDVADGDE
ncbi:MAG: ABC transporter ATP-binding protein [Haloferacaceae archaeon]